MGGDWTVERMLALGRLHADLEARGELDALMETLVPEPVYEFWPSGLAMRGGERVRRYYEQFIANFIPMTAGYELIEEWASETSVAQEYRIDLNVDGAVESHRVIGVLCAEGELLGGERIYGSDLFVRRMAGALYTELTPLADRR